MNTTFLQELIKPTDLFGSISFSGHIPLLSKQTNQLYICEDIFSNVYKFKSKDTVMKLYPTHVLPHKIRLRCGVIC